MEKTGGCLALGFIAMLSVLTIPESSLVYKTSSLRFQFAFYIERGSFMSECVNCIINVRVYPNHAVLAVL